jgi:hypothetical protein
MEVIHMNEKEKILSDFVSKKQQVEYILMHFPEARSNDFYLQYLWLKVFGKLNLPFIEWNTIKDISGKLETVSRVRRKIQNEDGKYLPSNDVRFYRQKKRQIITQTIGRI